MGGFGDIVMPILKDKAQKLGVTVAELETRLRNGDATLLTSLLSTGAGAAWFEQWQQRQREPGFSPRQ